MGRANIHQELPSGRRAGERSVQLPRVNMSVAPGFRVEFAIGLLAVLAIALLTRAVIPTPDAEQLPVTNVGGLSAGAQLEAAASAIEGRLAPGGTGFSFSVVERSTLYAKSGGPKIEVPDPIDRSKTLAQADEYYLGSVIASGVATPDGFFLQMRDGPATPEAAPDFATAPTTLAALVRDGLTWRNDGDGWYATDLPPGIGLDPVTVGLLPRLLRASSGPSVAGAGVIDGVSITTIAATAKVADAPGIMAVDAAGFTVLIGPMTFRVDDAGRLRELRALSRNTRMIDFDLIVETVITFDYPRTVPTLPEPRPVWSPAAAPQG